MVYNILTDKLPHVVSIGDTDYQIRADFRTSIRFELMMRNKRILDEEKLKRMIEMYYPIVPLDINKAMELVLWFYTCGRSEEKEKENRKDNKVMQKKKTSAKYSFSQDGIYIYSSFIEQYKINLQQIADDDLHWWEFIALFESLNDNTKMGQIIYYRTVSTTGMSSSKRRAVNEMKKLYALKDEADCDMKVALAKRNADWKEYVRKRVHYIK